MIRGYMEHGRRHDALDLYCQMLQGGVEPDVHIFIKLFKAFTGNIEIVRYIHKEAEMHGLTSQVLLGSTIIRVYGGCGIIEDAESVFLGLAERNFVSSNAMLSSYVEQQKVGSALRLYRQMQEEGDLTSSETIVITLQACANVVDKDETTREMKLAVLEIGRSLHADAWRKGFALNIFISSALLSLYGKCGAVAEAESVFLKLKERNEVVWTAMIAVYVKQNDGPVALQLYKQMLMEGVNSSHLVYVVALQACSSLVGTGMRGHLELTPLEFVNAFHFDAKIRGFTSNVFIGSTLLSVYAKCESITNAEHVFEGLTDRNEVCWCSMISAFVDQGQGERALRCYRQMQEEGLLLSQEIVVVGLRACIILAEGAEMTRRPNQILLLEIIRGLHTYAKRKQFMLNGAVTRTLVLAYAKCGVVVEAEHVFDTLMQKGVFSWSIMLATYIEHRQEQKALQLYAQMQEEGCGPDSQVLVLAIQACCIHSTKEKRSYKSVSLEVGRALHVDALQKGFTSGAFVGNNLLNMYMNFNNIRDAEHVFVELLGRNLSSWSSMLLAYIEHDEKVQALLLYRQLLEEAGCSNRQILILALQACSKLAETEATVKGSRNNKLTALEVGNCIFADAKKKGFKVDVTVLSTLIGMCGKCGCIREAEILFDKLPVYDIVSWTVMIMAYAECRQGENSLQLFQQMQVENCNPTEMTYISALQACNAVLQNDEVALAIVRGIHEDAQKKGYTSDVYVASTLLNSYGECGSIPEAEMVFISLRERDLVCWSAMLSSYVEQGEGTKALLLYRQMEEEKVTSNQQVLVIVLQACTALVGRQKATFGNERANEAILLEIGRALHGVCKKQGFTLNIFVCNALVTFYSKCGSLQEAECVFNRIPNPNSVSYNVLLSAYIEEGLAAEALQLFRRMPSSGVSPDDITIAYVLQACSMLGIADICMCIHSDIVAAGWDCDFFFANTLIRTYGSCANMANAEAVFDGLFDLNPVSWNAFLGGHVQQGSLLASFRIFDEMLKSRVSLDEVTLLSLLCICGHSSAVMAAIGCFHAMLSTYNVIPNIKHYVTFIDLLGRVGDFERVEHVLLGMPFQPDLSIFLGLLGVSRVHNNADLGRYAFDNAVNLQARDSAIFVLMSNICADVDVIESLRQAMFMEELG